MSHGFYTKCTEKLDTLSANTANEGTVRIQYKCLVPLYVYSYTHISVRVLNISRIGLPILLQGNMWTDPVNRS
jgi:hypothetical protein